MYSWQPTISMRSPRISATISSVIMRCPEPGATGAAHGDGHHKELGITEIYPV